MVLWEITVATAYFLGLKRTYRLALKIQRRVISPKFPRIRQFAQRRTRSAFDIALRVHRNIQERDIEVGRSIGNRILRLLDKMKPSANIRGEDVAHLPHPESRRAIKEAQKNLGGTHSRPSSSGSSEQGPPSDRHLFSAAKSMWPAASRKSFPMTTMMRQSPILPFGLPNNTQFRQISNLGYRAKGFDGSVRQDILLWMKSN